MDTQLLRYIREILIPAIGLNEFAAHKTDVAILEMIENNINPIFIPGGHTDVCQPLDVSINKPVKDYYEKYYYDWLEQNKTGDYTKIGNRKRLPYDLIFQWIASAVNEIRESTIIRSFERTGLKKGIWSSWEHISQPLRNYFLNGNDSEEQDRMLKDFNDEVNNNASEFLNAALIIEECSQENYLIE